MNDIVGTRHCAVDFHVHTPASTHDYKDKGATPEDIVAAAIQAGLNAIAITDHNTPAWIEAMQEAAKDSGLVVFPGVEINARGGHVIGLFDPAASLDIVETALIEAGISKSQWGEEDALGEDFVQVLAAIRKNKGMAIAAHADGPQGFFTTIQQGVTRQKIYKDPNLSALELVSLDKKDQYIKGKVPGYDRAIACIQGSDAHSLSEIGAKYTLLRMHHLSLEGVRHAFSEPTLRIHFPSEWTPPAYPYINSLCVSQGFLSEESFRFNPSLNCLVGGAGSGKSTVIEFLRFALDQISKMDHIAEDCFGKLTDLAGAGVCIEVVVVLETGEEIAITRVFDDASNPTSIKRVSDGQSLDDVDIRGIFPIHAYSQGEVISISRSPLAQLELIDKHLDLSKYWDEITQAHRDLSEQTTGLVRLEAVTRDRETVQRDIATTTTKIRSLTLELESLEKAQRSSVVTSHQLWIAEKNYLSDLVESFKRTKRNVEEKIEEIDLQPSTVPPPQEETPNRALLSECRELALQLEEAREEAKKAMLGKLSLIEGEILARARRWKGLYETHDAEYRRCQIEEGTVRIRAINAQLETLRNRLHNLRSKLQSIEAAERALNQQLEKRKELLEILQDRKARMFFLRQRKANDFVKKIGDTIQLRLVADGNRDGYRQLLLHLMKGTYAPQPVVQDLCNSVHPVELARYLREENVQKIDELSGIGEKWAEKTVDRANGQPEFIYDIEAVPLEDLLEISFKVGPGEYRPLSKLSTGQKATVIVLLTMVEGKQPIIFDQPEDALYTPFIYTEVVRTLRREKDQRQFILATHNPNIAIAGDADYGIVLEGTATQTTVEAAGGLDDQSTQKLMLWHLEGGEDALLTRQKKFGLK